MNCPKCGKEVFEGSPTCGNCGADVNGIIPVLAKDIARETAQTETEWLEDERKCLDAMACSENGKASKEIGYKNLEQKIQHASRFDNCGKTRKA